MTGRFRWSGLFALVVMVLSLGWAFVGSNPLGVDMTREAQAFVRTLSEAQRGRTLLEFQTPARVGWHFIPKDQRKGLQIKDMDAAQREAAHKLLRSAASQVGYDKAVTIMALEQILQELERNRGGGPVRDSERYFVTLFGEPAEKGRWGLSVEGHHLSLNFVVDQGHVVSSTPAFFGSNPAIVKNTVAGAPAEGTRVLGKEEQFAFDLLESLTPAQLETVRIAAEAPRDIRAAGEAQPPPDAPAGLAAGQMSDEQKRGLQRLVAAYLDNMPEEIRATRISEIEQAGPERVHFAWAGATRPGVGHYYRVQGPTFLIEFVNTQPDSAGNPANHIHCVWRDIAVTSQSPDPLVSPDYAGPPMANAKR